MLTSYFTWAPTARTLRVLRVGLMAIVGAIVFLATMAVRPTIGADGSLIDSLQAFLNSGAGLALQGLLVAAFGDFATGTLAALRDGTFSADALAAWVRKHIAGRVAPIGVLLYLSFYGGPAGVVFAAGAAAAAASYVTETVASVWGNLAPPKAADIKDTSEAAALNPVPED